MSTILEALKKSEQERKLTDLPTLSDIPAPQERSRWPIFLLAALLIIALLAIIWLLIRSESSGLQQQTSQQEESANLNTDSIEGAFNEQESSAISVDIISYSQDAKQRFVIIGGKMYREGEFVRTGLKVQTIEQDSVVLNNRGELVSRQP